MTPKNLTKWRKKNTEKLNEYMRNFRQMPKDTSSPKKMKEELRGCL